MSVTTRDGAKVGTEAYQVSIGRYDEHHIETIESRNYPTARAAEIWGLSRVRELNAIKDECDYDARIEHIRWVADNFHDEEHGLVRDGTVEYDRAYDSYCHGVTWHDDHAPGGPDWEDAR